MIATCKPARAVGRMLLGLVLALAVAVPTLAVEPDEVLSDAALEARARALSAELRCLVCQNQSIDDSNAPLARDLRLLVRERLKTGDSDAQVREFVVARYGEFVLLKPPLSSRTILLWLTPALILAGVAWLVLAALRRRMAAEPAGSPTASALSREEEEKLARILAEEDARSGNAGS